jgi:hypothetical protein
LGAIYIWEANNAFGELLPTESQSEGVTTADRPNARQAAEIASSERAAIMPYVVTLIKNITIECRGWVVFVLLRFDVTAFLHRYDEI